MGRYLSIACGRQMEKDTLLCLSCVFLFLIDKTIRSHLTFLSSRFLLAIHICNKLRDCLYLFFHPRPRPSSFHQSQELSTIERFSSPTSNHFSVICLLFGFMFVLFWLPHVGPSRSLRRLSTAAATGDGDGVRGSSNTTTNCRKTFLCL